MRQRIEFAEQWDVGDRNSGNATKGNIEGIVKAARELPNGGPLARAPLVVVVAGVHQSPWAARDRGRRPDGGVARGATGDWHWHITVDVQPDNNWHINVRKGKAGLWYPLSLYKRAGEGHFEKEPGERRWRRG